MGNGHGLIQDGYIKKQTLAGELMLDGGKGFMHAEHILGHVRA